VFAAFRQGLRELGYVEGKTITLEFRFAPGQAERLPALAAELVQLPVDVILTDTGVAAQAAKNATAAIPIVMGTSGDPVRDGLVTSLARPGGNVTGLTLHDPELSGKRLELLREAMPGVTQMAVFWNPSTPGHHHALRVSEAAAQVLHLHLQPVGVSSPDEIEAAFATVTSAGADVLVTLADAMLWNQRRRIAGLAGTDRLPTFFPEREFVEAGGLMAYGSNVPANFHRAAAYVDKILKGTKPADLPVEQPAKLELVINLKTAKALGLTLPPSFLFRADEVIR
jgi:putative ABC transport system substrate-binding protein